MRGAGQEHLLRGVSAVHVRMRHAAEDGHFVPVGTENVEIRCRIIIPAGALREKELRENAQIGFDGNHTPRRRLGRLRRLAANHRRQHRIQERQRDGHTGAAQKRAA